MTFQQFCHRYRLTPNYAMQRSSRVVTPLARTASGIQSAGSASGAPLRVAADRGRYGYSDLPVESDASIIFFKRGPFNEAADAGRL
jgi:hypothetical protein